MLGNTSVPDGVGVRTTVYYEVDEPSSGKCKREGLFEECPVPIERHFEIEGRIPVQTKRCIGTRALLRT